LIGQYEEVNSLLSLGAYTMGTNQRFDAVLEKVPQVYQLMENALAHPMGDKLFPQLGLLLDLQ
jgi:flagellar biosynthesis/type III secretory pathway ATPase